MTIRAISSIGMICRREGEEEEVATPENTVIIEGSEALKDIKLAGNDSA